MRSKLKINQRADEAIKNFLKDDKRRFRKNRVQFLLLKETIQYHRQVNNYSYLSIYRGLYLGEVIDYSYSTFMRYINKHIELESERSAKPSKGFKPIEKEAIKKADSKTQREKLQSEKFFTLETDTSQFI